MEHDPSTFWNAWTRWPEAYLISNKGDVRSIQSHERPHPKIKIHRGIKVISFYRERVRCQYPVHRMVAETFMPYYDPSLQVRFVDNQSKCPSIENLYQRRLPDIGSYVPNYFRSWEVPGARPVYNVQTGEEFLSVTDAAEHYGVTETNIRQVLNGHRIHTLGFQFERLEPYGV